MPETLVRSTDYSRQLFGVFSLLALGVFAWPLVAGSGLLEVGFALTL